MASYKKLSAKELEQVDLSEGIIVDVRTKMEHAEKRLASGHTLMMLDELNPGDFMARHGLDKDFNVYILCRSGQRAARAAEKFIKAGYNNVYVIEGGLVACEEQGHDLEGYAVNKNNVTNNIKAPISLERQVRISAGLIAALGALFSLTIHPLFSIIPLFVGSGLVFAGVTDRCGMALVLTKAPWNKTAVNDSCTAPACSIPTKANLPKSNKTGQTCH